jgi:hypothetical protein
MSKRADYQFPMVLDGLDVFAMVWIDPADPSVGIWEESLLDYAIYDLDGVLLDLFMPGDVIEDALWAGIDRARGQVEYEHAADAYELLVNY